MKNPQFSFTELMRSDIPAGVAVFLVALPLCLGIASACGVPLLSGLVSGIVGGLVVSWLSGSALSVTGPAAGLVVIVVSGIADLGGLRPFLAAVLLAGLLQIALGSMRAGRLIAFIPGSVIKGMLASIGLLLVIGQTPTALGLSRSAASHASGIFAVSWVTLILTTASLAILFAWNSSRMNALRWARAIPSPLVVVVLGGAVTAALDAFAPSLAPVPALRVNVPSLLHVAAQSAWITPDLTRLGDLAVWRVAVAVAIVAGLETLLSLQAVETIDPLHRRASANRELIAQGVGNIAAACLGGLPVTAVIVRSSVNVHAGAKSRLSCVIHGVLLVLSMCCLTELLSFVPLSCLAAILLHTGYKLAHPKIFRSLARQGMDRFAPFAITIVGVLATDLLMGIAIGAAVGIVMTLIEGLHKTVSFTTHDDHCLLRFRKDVSVLAKVKLAQCLANVPDHSTLIIDAERADVIDPDIREMVETFSTEAPQRGITVDRHHWPEEQRPRSGRLIFGVTFARRGGAS